MIVAAKLAEAKAANKVCLWMGTPGEPISPLFETSGLGWGWGLRPELGDQACFSERKLSFRKTIHCIMSKLHFNPLPKHTLPQPSSFPLFPTKLFLRGPLFFCLAQSLIHQVNLNRLSPGVFFLTRGNHLALTFLL